MKIRTVYFLGFIAAVGGAGVITSNLVAPGSGSEDASQNMVNKVSKKIPQETHSESTIDGLNVVDNLNERSIQDVNAEANSDAVGGGEKNLSQDLDYLLSLYHSKKYNLLLDELRKAQYQDPFYIEELFQKYMNSESEEDQEKVWLFIDLLKDEAITDTLAMALDNATSDELAGWLRVVPDTSAFSNVEVRESVLDLIHNSTNSEVTTAALGALNVNLSDGVDRGLVESAITKRLNDFDPDVRVAAMQQHADWFDDDAVKDQLAIAFEDQSEKVKIAAMSVLEAKNIKDDSFKNALLDMVSENESGSDLYLYSMDTLEYYYGFSGEQIAKMISE